MKQDYIEKNKAQYLRLKNILNNLTDNTWRYKVKKNWNVGNMLWHLAFWDKMTFERLSAWKTKGIIAPVPDSENIDAINSSTRYLSDLLDLKSSISFILDCAESVDEMVARFESADIDFLQESGKERWFKRYMHRSEHLNSIEESLK